MDYWIKGTHPHPSLDWADNQANPSVAYPFVEETNTTPAGQKTTHRAKEGEWEYMHDVNEWMGCGDSMPYVRKSGSGAINHADNKIEYPFGTTVPRYPNPYPKMAGVASGHNYVRSTGQKKNGAVEIYMFDTDKPFPNVEDVNPTTHPWLFDEFHSINKRGEVGLAPEGKRFYYPRACKGGKAWMPLEILEEREIPANLYKKVGDTTNDSGQEQPMTRAQGIDFAVLANGGYDIAKVEKPHDFVVANLTRGMSVDYTSWYWNLTNPKRTGFDAAADISLVPRRLLYHFLDYKDGTWQEQADFFVAAFKQAEQETDVKFHAAVCDYEVHKTSQITWDAPVFWVYGKMAYNWIPYVEDKLQVPVIGYTNPNTWVNIWNSDYRSPQQHAPHWWAQYPYAKWNADVLTYPENKDRAPWVPPYYQGEWLMWQYSADENGVAGLGPKNGLIGSQAVDLDIFNGTTADMDAWLGIGEPDPEPTDCDAAIAAAVAKRDQEIIDFIKG